MTRDRAGLPPPPSRSGSLAILSTVLWLAAAASTSDVALWSALGGVAAVLGLTILLLDRAATAQLLRPSLNHLLLGAAAGCLMATATELLYPQLARLLPSIVPDTARLYTAFRAPSLLVASVALFPVIVGEELVWRGVVQTSLARHLGPALGVVVAALVYALVHTPVASPVLLAAALGCGLAWGALRALTASLVPSVLAHLIWNVFILLWRPLDGG